MNVALVVLATVAALAGSDGSPTSAAEAPEIEKNAASREYELYFEFKLAIRGREFMRRVALDQWAGGRMRMRTDSIADATGHGLRFSLIGPIEDPWTYRWYPTKREAKLGAAVSVPDPAGDAYGSLAPGLIPLAARRHADAWGGDRVHPEIGAAPDWKSRTEGFWDEVHSRGKESRDPLHADPVYPFYVLGDPSGRLRFVVADAGNVRADSIGETMSGPWLPRGWEEWLAGSRRSGYGYWEDERPRWEPRTYETMTRALHLLAWSGLSGSDAPREFRVRVRRPDLAAEAAAVVTTLIPRAEGRLDWSGPIDFRVRRVAASDDRGDSVRGDSTAFVGESGPTPMPGESDVVLRAWRYSDRDSGRHPAVRDELQLLAEHVDGRSMKLWIRIGYRPVDDPPRPARSSSTEPRGG